MPRVLTLLACCAAIAVAGGVALYHGGAGNREDGTTPFANVIAGRTDDVAELGLQARNAQRWNGTELVEAAGACNGHGRYWLRDGAQAAPLVLTAPHGGSDLETDQIVEKLFVEGDAAAAAFNSAPRTPTAECNGFALDLARQADHPFTDFARAFASEHPGGVVVQLHGFDAEVRGTDTSMIVSNGTRQPDAALMDLADCLSIAIAPDHAMIYPVESDRLGGAENAQGAALRALGKARFVHLETSADLRQRLVEEAALRTQFGACLSDSVQ